MGSKRIKPDTDTVATSKIRIDGRSKGHIFDGVGGISAGASSRLLYDYPESERSQILDYLFKPNYGAELQILKVEIGGDMNSTTGSEPSHMREQDEVNCDLGYEWWLMKEAKKRNPNIELAGLAWGAPGWIEGGFWSQDNINYLMSWLDCAEAHDLEIDYIGGGNERGYDPEWYVHFAEALDERYPDVDLIAADEGPTAEEWPVATTMKNDPDFSNAVDVVGQHSPQGNPRLNPDYRDWSVTDDALSLDKPLWASEYSSLSHNVGAASIARAITRGYVDAQVTGQLIWTAISAWYANLRIADTGPLLAEWPWSGYYEIGKSVWSLAHITQFTDPGWQYLDTGCGYLDSGASYVTLRSPSSGDYSTIIETMDTTASEKVRFDVSDDLSTENVSVWATDLIASESANHFRHIHDVDPVDGSYEVTLQPGHIYTLSTTTGQRKGNARPDAGPAEQLSVPFQEDFEGYETQELARYFSDLNGGFQTEPCGGNRDGQCYEQVVTREPIYWHDQTMVPTTVAGDPRWWGDYEVSVDVMVKNPGTVELLGRVDTVNKDGVVSGYHLEIANDGAWRLYSEDGHGSETALDSGTTSFDVGSWHTLTLQFVGDTIRATVDETEIAAVTDSRHRSGQIGLRVGDWDRAQFDNVQVDRTRPWPDFLPHAQMTATATSSHTENSGGYKYPASAAVDDRPETYWRSEWDPFASLPQSITIDLNAPRDVRALTYQPHHGVFWWEENSGNPITDYAVYLSENGDSFEKVTSGTWRNSLAATKVATWEEDYTAQFVRLEATNSSGAEGSVTASNINVSSTPIHGISASSEKTPKSD